MEIISPEALPVLKYLLEVSRMDERKIIRVCSPAHNGNILTTQDALEELARKGYIEEWNAQPHNVDRYWQIKGPRNRSVGSRL